MPFCASCGSQAEGAFCPKCGAPVGAGAAPPPQGAGAPPPVAGSAPMADNVASALCYLLIPAIVFLVIEPYNRNKTVRFNAFQSIFLFVALIFVRIALTIVFGILFTAGGGFWVIYALFYPLFGLVCLCLWLYLLVLTYQGKAVVLPIIGPLAQKQA